MWERDALDKRLRVNNVLYIYLIQPYSLDIKSMLRMQQMESTLWVLQQIKSTLWIW
jgi:hypothetical protein